MIQEQLKQLIRTITELVTQSETNKKDICTIQRELKEVENTMNMYKAAADEGRMLLVQHVEMKKQATEAHEQALAETKNTELTAMLHEETLGRLIESSSSITHLLNQCATCAVDHETVQQYHSLIQTVHDNNDTVIRTFKHFVQRECNRRENIVAGMKNIERLEQEIDDIFTKYESANSQYVRMREARRGLIVLLQRLEKHQKEINLTLCLSHENTAENNTCTPTDEPTTYIPPDEHTRYIDLAQYI